MRRIPGLLVCLTIASAIALAIAGTAWTAAAHDGDIQAMTPLSRLHEGIPHRVTFRDPYAYLAMDSGLAVYDLRAPLAPVRVSHLSLPSPAFDVEVSGNLAFVANGESGLTIIDIGDVSRPLVVGTLATSGTRAVALAGSIAYLAEASDRTTAVFGLRTVDVSVPASPQSLSFLPLPNGALDVAVAGGVAFLGLGSEVERPHGLYAVNVTNPAAPVALGVLPTGKAVNEMAVSAGRAFLATGFPSTGALVVADISSPGAPVAVASVLLSDGAMGATLSGTTLFLAARSLGLLSLDVSAPATPVMLDALPTGRETVGVAAYPGFAFLAERASIERAAFTVADASFPSAVRALSSVPFAEATATAAGPARGYFLQRDALWIADTSNPGAPVWLGAWRPPRGDFSSLAVEGTLAAVGEADVVHLVDLTDPAIPVTRGDAVVSKGVAVRSVLAGNTLHVVNGHGFETFDISSPGAPASLATFDASGWSAGLALDGTKGYLVAEGTLRTLDLAVPSSPMEMGSVTLPGEQLYGVDAVGALGVATGYGATLHVFDLSNPALPVLVATLPGPGGFDVRLAGDRALVAAGTSGVEVIDLRIPTAPVLEGFLDTSGTAIALSIEGQNVYLATNEAQHWAVRCDTCAQTCSDTWPAIAANSLLAVRSPAGAMLSWQLQSGSGGFNVHRTASKSSLLGLFLDGSKLVGTTVTLTLDDAFAPSSGQCGYYRVYPRASCSGASVGP